MHALCLDRAARDDTPVGTWQVCCNLATMTHPLFDKQPVPYALSPKTSNPKSLDAAVDAAVSMLRKVSAPCPCTLMQWCLLLRHACHEDYEAFHSYLRLMIMALVISSKKRVHLQSPKPVILVGPQAKPFKSIEAMCNLADKTKYATAVIPNAKVSCCCSCLHCAFIVVPWLGCVAVSPGEACITQTSEIGMTCGLLGADACPESTGQCQACVAVLSVRHAQEVLRRVSR